MVSAMDSRSSGLGSGLVLERGTLFSHYIGEYGKLNAGGSPAKS